MIARYRARCLFTDFLLSLAPLFSLFFLPRLLTRFLFFFVFLVPHQVSNHLPLPYLLLMSLSSTPLHYEVQLRFTPSKLIFILLDSFALQKIYITMFNACCTLHENMHCICGANTPVATSKESGFSVASAAKPKPVFFIVVGQRDKGKLLAIIHAHI